VRTLRALEYFSEGSRTQADLAGHLEVHRRTARRLIARLVAEGYLEPVEEGARRISYTASSRLVVLGGRVASGLDLSAISRRHLDQLDATMVESRFLARRLGDTVSLVSVEPGREPGGSRSPDVLAETVPLHATAAGKVFLSAENDLLESALNQELLGFTAHTVTSRADLLLELAAGRSRGYAKEDREHQADQQAVASPVVDYAGNTVAALGARPAPGVELDQLGVLVARAGLECSRAIGAALTFANEDRIDTLT
jgi:DNA-binding IclR family transcriptional regulator